MAPIDPRDTLIADLLKTFLVGYSNRTKNPLKNPHVLAALEHLADVQGIEDAIRVNLKAFISPAETAPSELSPVIRIQAQPEDTLRVAWTAKDVMRLAKLNGLEMTPESAAVWLTSKRDEFLEILRIRGNSAILEFLEFDRDFGHLVM